MFLFCLPRPLVAMEPCCAVCVTKAAYSGLGGACKQRQCQFLREPQAGSQRLSVCLLRSFFVLAFTGMRGRFHLDPRTYSK